ncbi:MAG: N-acetylglutamate synthase, partial [Pseudonocardiales bacterium]|nr:N-acetylglutamate synthase [Pseudonocardiales bacterium]
ASGDHLPAGRVRFGDVVGDLVGLDSRTAVVDTRRGPVEIDLGRIAFARLVPASTADELALDAVAARGLRAAEHHQLGGWVLRANSGFTHRANSVLPLRSPGLPLDAALEQAAVWYAARGLPVQLQVPVEARRLLDAELGERGWPAELPTRVYVARLDALRPAPGSGPSVAVETAPDDAWLGLYRGGSGADEAARDLLTRHDTVAFASLRLAGRTVAVGRGAVDDGWLGVMAVEVDPAYRRQGLAAAVMAALCAWGGTVGAVRSYLQVAVDNAPAVALYEKLGFWGHHDYHYRTAPAST